MDLANRLRRVGIGLSAILLSWRICAGVSMANDGALLAEEKTEAAETASEGLSTDLLEVPVEVPVEVPIEGLEEGLAISEEIPEEILRTEIITGARSPMTGEPMTAAEYAQLQEALDGPVGTPIVSSNIRYLIFLLQVRRAVRPILPFIR